MQLIKRKVESKVEQCEVDSLKVDITDSRRMSIRAKLEKGDKETVVTFTNAQTKRIKEHLDKVRLI